MSKRRGRGGAAKAGGSAPARPATVKVYLPAEKKSRLQERAKRVNRSLSEYMGLAAEGKEIEELWKTVGRVDLRMMNLELRRLSRQLEAGQQMLSSEGVERWQGELERVIEMADRALREVLSAATRKKSGG